MIQALQFVKENIAAFNGDPNSVTLMGESAGASNAGLLMVSPLSKGLFHQAILLSGNDLTSFAYINPLVYPKRFTFDVGSQHDCAQQNSKDLVECMRGVPAMDLVRTFPKQVPLG